MVKNNKQAANQDGMVYYSHLYMETGNSTHTQHSRNVQFVNTVLKDSCSEISQRFSQKKKQHYKKNNNTQKLTAHEKLTMQSGKNYQMQTIMKHAKK